MANAQNGCMCGFLTLWTVAVSHSGALTFLFANIIVSGIKLIGFDRIDRRTHYIVATSLALGVGTALVPAFSSPGIGPSAARPNQWWPYKEDMSDALDSFRVGCMISINTPYFIGSLCAIFLNLVIPTDLIDDAEIEVEETWHLKECEGEEVKDAKELSSEEEVNAVDKELGEVDEEADA
eukprot:scaffold2997_cov182-Amphora_coffeaeformis.AAC.5